jgi:hypothetical protein
LLFALEFIGWLKKIKGASVNLRKKKQGSRIVILAICGEKGTTFELFCGGFEGDNSILVHKSKGRNHLIMSGLCATLFLACLFYLHLPTMAQELALQKIRVYSAAQAIKLI